MRERETWEPTKAMTLVTRRERLEGEEWRADMATHFFQWELSQESLRERRWGEAEGDDGDRTERKKEDQRVSLESEEWIRRRLYGNFFGFNFAGVEGAWSGIEE